MIRMNLTRTTLVFVIFFILHLFVLTRNTTVPVSQFPIVLTNNYIQTKYKILKGNQQKQVHPICQITSECEMTFVYEDDTKRRSMLRDRINRNTFRFPSTLKQQKGGWFSIKHKGLPNFGMTITNEYDYDNITYPIPFNQLYWNKTMRYIDFGGCESTAPMFVNTGEVTDKAFVHNDYLFITGCSDNHLLVMVNMLYTLLTSNLFVSVVIVDLGISPEKKSLLWKELKIMHHVQGFMESHAQWYYRQFDFSHFPAWWSLSNRMIRGGYAWKVVSIFDVLLESKQMVIWVDSGNRIHSDLSEDLHRALQHGFYSPSSGGSVRQWTFGSTRHFIQSQFNRTHLRHGKDMCTAGYMIINYNNREVMNSLVLPLLQCAYTRKCISPYGSSRKNHRQEQSALSVLVHSMSIPMACDGYYRTGMLYHRDCKENCQQLRENVKHTFLERYLRLV